MIFCDFVVSLRIVIKDVYFFFLGWVFMVYFLLWVVFFFVCMLIFINGFMYICLGYEICL